MSDGEHQKITYLGKIDYRDKQVTFGIKENDRTKHTYIIGKSGMGKSTLLENLIIQDITGGEGVCVIDPHGALAETILHYIPESRIKDVVYFAPFDGDFPMGLNMLEKVSAEKRYLLANGMMSAFKKIFTDGDGKGTFSARMEYVLNNIILALLENEGQTLLGVNRMLFDKEYRKFIVSNVTDPTVKDFWVNEYANYTDKTAQELAPSIQNKIGQFVSNPLIRNIIGQKKTSFDIRKIMDEKKIFIANLSKGKVGEGNANLLGSLLITKIYLAAMSRADVDVYEAKNLPPCYFYVDEFQNFANESFASILSEARKYKLALTVAHQYIEQMTDEVRSAVFGNVGTMITFRIGATDAEIFEKEFAPKFVLDDFVNLSAYQIYLRLMIDGQGSQPFSARTLPPTERPAHSYEQAVIAYSRLEHAKQKFLVEDEIMEFYKPVPKVEKIKTEIPSPDVKFLKVNEYKNEQPSYPSKRNDSFKRFDAKKNNEERRYQTSPITRYDSPERKDEKQNIAHSSVDTAQAVVANSEPATVVHKENNIEKNNIREEQKYIPEVEKKEIKIESVFDTVKQPVYKKEYVDKTVEQKPTPVFDDKPAMSLKEALEKALKDQKPITENVSQKKDTTDQEDINNDVVKNRKTKEDAQISSPKKKEVPEDVLRKLIEE